MSSDQEKTSLSSQSSITGVWGGREWAVPLSTTPVFGISDVTQMKLEQGKPSIIHRYLRGIETAAKPA